MVAAVADAVEDVEVVVGIWSTVVAAAVDVEVDVEAVAGAW